MLSVQSLIREISPVRRPGQTPGAAAADARLIAALDLLADTPRLALSLHCFERLPVAAIATVLGLGEADATRLLEEAAETVARAMATPVEPSRPDRAPRRSRR